MKLYLLPLLLLLTACTDTIVAKYDPASKTYLGGGAIKIGEVKYEPVKQGIAMNQVRADYAKAAKILLNRPVAEYMEEALRMELQSSGISVMEQKARCTVNATVTNLEFDNSGFSNKYRFTSHYQLIGETGKTLIERDETTEAKYYNVFKTRSKILNRLVSKNIKQLFYGKEFASYLQSSCYAKEEKK